MKCAFPKRLIALSLLLCVLAALVILTLLCYRFLSPSAIVNQTTTSGKQLGLEALAVKGVNAAPAESAALEPQAKARLSESFGKLPLAFIENRGQMDGRVAYYVQGQDKTVYFTAQGITHLLSGKAAKSATVTPATSLLDKTSPAVAVLSDCAACVFGPRTYTRTTGAPVEDRSTFTGDPAADYLIDIDDGGSQGADASVTLNDVVQLAPRTKVDVGHRHVRRAVSLLAQNSLKVRLTGKPGAFLRYEPARNAWTEPLQWFDENSKTLVIRTTEFSGWALWAPKVWSGLPRQLLWDIDMSKAPDSKSTTGFASQVQLAFSLWQAETGAAGLTFRRILPGETPNIVVEFADLEFGSTGVTYGIHTYEFGIGFGKRYVRLNKNLSGWESPISYLADVVIHEVGHAIGMRHIGSGEEPPIMAPQPNFQSDLHLYQADINQVRSRYNIVLPTLQKLVSSSHILDYLSISGSTLAFTLVTDFCLTQPQTLLQVPTNGGTVTTLASGLICPRGVLNDGTNIYWIDGSSTNGAIRRIPVGGGTITTLATGIVDASGRLMSDGTSLYFNVTNYNANFCAIRKMPLTGGAIIDVVSESSCNTLTFTISGGIVYYFAGTNPGLIGTIKRVSTAGGIVTTLTTNVGFPAQDILVSGTRVYWSSGTGIFSVATSAVLTAPTTLVSGVQGRALATDGTSLYVAAQHLGVLRYSLSNFASVTTLYPSFAFNLALDGQSVYFWTDFDNSIGRGIAKTLK